MVTKGAKAGRSPDMDRDDEVRHLTSFFAVSPGEGKG